MLNIAGYISSLMVTISADLTNVMKKYIDSLVKKGLYKSRSEVMREAIREMMEQKDYIDWLGQKEDERNKEQMEYMAQKGLLSP